MYPHTITAAGITAIPSVIFRRRHSLLLLTFVFLVSGCGENNSPHPDRATLAAAPAPEASPSIPQSVMDSSADSIPAPAAKTIAQMTDSLSTKKNVSARRADSVAKTETPSTIKTSTEKAQAPAKDQEIAKTGGSGQSEKSAEGGGCADVTPDLIKQGRMIFTVQGNCASCHGMDGKGNPLGPDLTDSKWLHISGDYASIAKTVRTGVNLVIEHSTPMPPMGGGRLSNEEICAVAAYVWSLTH